jgi:RNA polymerase sigma-70 factor (ECF subfamily)
LQTLHLAEPNKTVEDLADQNQHHSELWKAVHALDEKHRLPVMLRFIYGMSAVEIAQALQISEGTVYSRLHYAIQMLRNHLGSTFNERGKNE